MQRHFHFWKHDFTIICSPMLNLQGVIILSIKIKRMVIVSWATKYISMRKMINRIYFRIYTTQINTHYLPHCTIQVNSYSSIICEREKLPQTLLVLRWVGYIIVKNFVPHCPEALRYAKVWGRDIVRSLTLAYAKRLFPDSNPWLVI